MRGTCLEWALDLLSNHSLWPIAIKPGDKAPLGESWGTARPTEQSIRGTFKRFPRAGVGLLLGPDAGIIDIECDGPAGEDSLARLLGGEFIPTLGWSSARGPHHVFRYDARLARYGKSIIRISELPDLEIRVGGNGKQLQSNCPPTIGSDGEPRRWNGHWHVAELPEYVFSFLDTALSRRKSGISGNVRRSTDQQGKPPSVPSTQRAYAMKALGDECRAVELARDGEQNATLNAAAYSLGQLVGAGILDRSDVERQLLEAANGYAEKDGELAALATIHSGLNAGQNHPRDLSHLEPDRNRRHAPSRNETSAESPPWPPLRFSELPPALPFPVDVFPLCLRRFCRELAEATLAPLDFVGLSMLVVAGAAIGQSVNIKVKEGWNEPPLLYGILVAPPGKAKSPVVRAVAKPLSDIDRRLRQESAEAREEWESRKKDHTKDDSAPLPGPPPPRRRAVVKDTTRESLALILADNPRGVLCDPDEAAGWVASFNEYKGKGGSDRQFWLSNWCSAPIHVDRKGGLESINVPFPLVPVLGGLPPDMLTCFREERGRNDGLLDRIVFAYPASFPPQAWTEKELSPEAASDWSEAIGRLFDVHMVQKDGQLQPHLVTFTTEAKALWVAWFNSHAAEMDDPGFPDRHAGVWSKLRAHAARFALILSRLRIACDPCPPDGQDESSAPVTADDVRGAIELVNYFKSHSARIGRQMTGGMGTADAKAVVEWIKRHRKTDFREAEVREDLRRFREHPDDLADALAALKALGALRHRPVPPEHGKRGPKCSPAYDVHPDLLGAPDNAADSGISPLEAPAGTIRGIGGIIGRALESDPPPRQ